MAWAAFCPGHTNKERCLSDLKIFFASDIHGSEVCFRKFLNAARAYQVDSLIMGGDITGKLIVPIVEIGKGRYTFEWLGNPYTVPADALAEHIRQIRMSGAYIYLTNPDEMMQLEENPLLVKDVFRRTMKASMVEWLELAEERLSGSGIECFITPGNDDDLALDDAFTGKNAVCNPEGKIVHIRGEIEMISTGYSNITPWCSPRELEENALYAKIQLMASGLSNPQRSIFNLHCPPYDYGLDIAARLDKSLKPIAGIGGVEMGPVGSHAVLKAIQTYRPMLGLHGHVHESRGAVKVGRTLCVNPGSEYTEGILRGCLVLINRKGVSDYLLTSG